MGIEGTEDTAEEISSYLRLICLPCITIPILMFIYALFSSTIGRALGSLWSILLCRCFRGVLRNELMRLCAFLLSRRLEEVAKVIEAFAV